MKNILLLILLFAGLTAFGQKNYKVEDIPDPKISGQDYYVSDPDGLLDNTSSLNELITKLETATKTEIAVVIVKDFDKNLDEFEFAINLFRKWGIGKKGANNGLLLFASVNRRKYRIVTGYGLEGLLPDVKLKHIAERNLLPAFRAQQYGKGIENTLTAIAERLQNPDNAAEIQSLANTKSIDIEKLNKFTPLLYSVGLIALFVFGFRFLKRLSAPFKIKKKGKTPLNQYEKSIAGGCGAAMMITFVSVFIWGFGFGFEMPNVKLSYIPIFVYVILVVALFIRYLSALSTLRNAHNDDENFFEATKNLNRKIWPLALLSPLVLIGVAGNTFKRKSLVGRFTPPLDSKNKEMIRMDRDENLLGKPYLNKGQCAEEKLLVYDYDIWESVDKKEHQIKVWPAETYNRYSECPACSFRTLSRPKVETIKRATYQSSGQGKEIQECGNCKHEIFIKMVTLARLVESSSSSGSSSSGSSSSSSSGSWGGGSSGGGGTGGSW